MTDKPCDGVKPPGTRRFFYYSWVRADAQSGNVFGSGVAEVEREFSPAGLIRALSLAEKTYVVLNWWQEIDSIRYQELKEMAEVYGDKPPKAPVVPLHQVPQDPIAMPGEVDQPPASG